MKLLASIACALPLAACSDGNDATDGTSPTARELHLRIENVAPWTVLKASAQHVKTSGAPGIAGPGDAYELHDGRPGVVVRQGDERGGGVILYYRAEG